MKYTMLLWPHANARYQQETRRLALMELELMLSRLAPEVSASVDEKAPMPCLSIVSPGPLDDGTVRAISTHSLLYGLFETREDGSLVPVAGRTQARLGADLPAILKYKGKTNEMFLQLLASVALYAGDYWNAQGPLELLDPMCGRATAPFIALNRGWNAVGADVDKTGLREAEKFFKRYLEYHRFKHSIARESRTIRGKKPVPVTRFEAAESPERFKAGDALSLSLAELDAALLGEAFGRNRFHLIVCDLPYGVKHDAHLEPEQKSKNWLETLLARALRGMLDVLKPGGAAALSFNAQTLRRDRLRGMMADAGFEVCAGGPYDGFEHWVEQAITRDIAVGRKPSR